MPFTLSFGSSASSSTTHIGRSISFHPSGPSSPTIPLRLCSVRWRLQYHTIWSPDCTPAPQSHRVSSAFLIFCLEIRTRVGDVVMPKPEGEATPRKVRSSSVGGAWGARLSFLRCKSIRGWHLRGIHAHFPRSPEH